MSKIYRFSVFDGPPYFYQQFSANTSLRPKYLGDLIQIKEWQIQEEMNELGSSASITIVPTGLQRATENEKTFLTAEGKVVTTSGTGIIVGETTTIKITEHNFLNINLEYGHFIKIASYNNSTKREQILFYGMITSWEFSSQSQNVVLRLVSLGHLAGQEFAANSFQKARGYKIKTIAQDGSTSSTSALIKRTTFDKWRFFYQDPMRVLLWLFNFNPFVRVGNVIDKDGQEFNWETGGPLGNTYKVNIVMEADRTIDLLKKCFEYFPADWFLEIDYDIPQIVPKTSIYNNNAYKPVVNIRQSKPNIFSGVSNKFEVDYLLTRGKEVVRYELNYSGEDSFQYQATTSAAQGELRVTDLPEPDAQTSFVETEYRPTYEDVTNSSGTVIGTQISEQSKYVEKIKSDLTSFGAGGDWLPVTVRNKKLNTYRLQYPRQNVETRSSIPTPSAQAERDQLKTGIIGELTTNNFLKSTQPVSTGKVVVIDTDDRKIEDYKLGDVIGFRFFGNIMDFVQARIVGKTTKHLEAILDLSFVLSTTNRRLKALENDLRNR